MVDVIHVADLSLPELAPYAGLTGAQLRAADVGLFICESAVVIGHALDAGMEPVSLLMTEHQIPSHRGLIDRMGDAPVYAAPESALEQLTGYRITRGVLCAMRRPPQQSAAALLSAGGHGMRRVAILQDIIDPTNVGAIFRSAAALGMDAVLLSPSCCDPLHRRSVRVSMGTVFQIPWARIGDAASDWPAAGIGLLHELGYHLAAMALDYRAISVEDESLQRRDKLCVVLGTEGTGLRQQTIDLCDDTVMIPMANGVDSLNVGAAAAVAFWQLRAK